MISTDTIAAISSATGPSARMIVRLSGPRSLDIGSVLCPASTFHPGRATFTYLKLRGMTLPIAVYAFVSGRSFTGDDLLEFHLPGNPLLCRLLLAECLRLGARSAEAGEFAARAYFNRRIDLTKAEGIAASIASQNAQELRAARQLLAGELAQRLQPILDSLAQTLALVEAGIDFAGEDISLLPRDVLGNRLTQIQTMLSQLLSESARVEQHWHRRRAILVGSPNAGKSTLLNALAQSHRAVVSPQAGTTRDAVSAEVTLRRGIVHIVDAAGLEDEKITGIGAEADIARQMQDTARQALQTADWVLLVHDLTSTESPLILPRSPDLVIYTKHDLTHLSRSKSETAPMTDVPDADIPLHRYSGGGLGRGPVNLAADLSPFPEGISSEEANAAQNHPNYLTISAHTGYHLDELRNRLDELAFGTDAGGAVLALNARHIQAIDEAQAAIHRAIQSADAAELLAADLRQALDSLGSILGQVTPDDLLGRIFSSFCIGK